METPLSKPGSVPRSIWIAIVIVTLFTFLFLAAAFLTWRSMPNRDYSSTDTPVIGCLLVEKHMREQGIDGETVLSPSPIDASKVIASFQNDTTTPLELIVFDCAACLAESDAGWVVRRKLVLAPFEKLELNKLDQFRSGWWCCFARHANGQKQEFIGIFNFSSSLAPVLKITPAINGAHQFTANLN